MSEVQHLAQSLVAKILRHNLTFEAAGTKQVLLVVIQRNVHHCGIGDVTVLEHLGQTGTQLTVGQGAQVDGVDRHLQGLGEDPNLVLGTTKVHAGFAAISSIDHSEQRSRDVDEGDAALITCRHETAQVADRPASEVHQHGLTIGMVGQQRRPDVLGGVEGLALLPGRHHKVDGLLTTQPMLGLGQPQRSHVLVGQDEDLGGGCQSLFQFL